MANKLRETIEEILNEMNRTNPQKYTRTWYRRKKATEAILQAFRDDLENAHKKWGTQGRGEKERWGVANFLNDYKYRNKLGGGNSEG